MTRSPTSRLDHAGSGQLLAFLPFAAAKAPVNHHDKAHHRDGKQQQRCKVMPSAHLFLLLAPIPHEKGILFQRKFILVFIIPVLNHIRVHMDGIARAAGFCFGGGQRTAAARADGSSLGSHQTALFTNMPIPFIRPFQAQTAVQRCGKNDLGVGVAHLLQVGQQCPAHQCRGSDLDDKVIAAGHAVALQDLRFALDHFKEMVPFRYRRLDGNQRLDSVILAGVVQAHGIAADDALLLHAVDTAGHRRTGQVDLFGRFP